MSRLATRISGLEQKLPACPSCAERPVQTELLTHSRPRPTEPDHCPECGEPVERIVLVLAFDPHLPAHGERR
jgi:hypothetical protein